jgi:predicted ATPase
MPTITKLHVENFGCVKNVDVALTPLHAFIGPNDSGKSTLLKAIEWGFFAGASEHDLRRRSFVEPVQVVRGTRVVFSRSDAIDLEFAVGDQLVAHIHGMRLPTATLVRLDPDSLRQPSQVILEDGALRFENDRGLGLASIYDALTSRDFGAFVALRDGVLQLFPTIAEIGFPAASSDQRTIRVKLKDGAIVQARALSEGLLYFLALAVLPHVEAGGMILLEEPENGLHPARIAEVLRVLREVSKTTQVILATHNPLVINELEPDEVSVVTRDAVAGTKVTPIADTPKFDERFKVYRLGELWLAYSDGEMESPLLEGGPRL